MTTVFSLDVANALAFAFPAGIKAMGLKIECILPAFPACCTPRKENIFLKMEITPARVL